jgi:hypothetical protein
LKSLADDAKAARERAADTEQEKKAMFKEQANFVDNVRMGNIHDGRLDCVAGNGIMGELGMGVEPEPQDERVSFTTSLAVSSTASVSPQAHAQDGVNSPEEGTPDTEKEEKNDKRTLVPLLPIPAPTAQPQATSPEASATKLKSSRLGEYSQIYGPASIAKALAAAQPYDPAEDEGKSSTADLDQIPVVVIKGFDEKDAGAKGHDVLYSGMADWAAALVENKVS